MSHSKILIGVIANDFARASEFLASMLRMKRPAGSDLEFLIGGDWCEARNQLAQQALDGGYTHLWFMDDDHSFSPDLLLQIAAWNKPLVTPICLQRVFPFAPVSYVKAPPELAHHGDFIPIDLSGHPGGGLVELEAGGAAGMLIRRDVLEAVREHTRTGVDGQAIPWFEYTDKSEDVLFCEKAKACGYTIWADLGARLGHITTCVVIPSYTEEHGWTTGLRIGRDYDIRVKQTYDLIEDGRRDIPAADVEATLEETPANDVILEAPEADTIPPSENPEGIPGVAADPFVVEERGAAERIEIWMDEELRWWWRALDDDGTILARDSGVREQDVIERALSVYPGAMVHQIAREIEDSRKQEQYGPPRRIWNREVGQ